MDLFMTNS